MKYSISMLGLALFASPILAQNISIENPGFSGPRVYPGTFSTYIEGWEATGALGEFGVFNPDYKAFEGANSGNVAFIRNGAIFQELKDVVLRPETTYTLSVESGRTMADPFYGFILELAAGDLVLSRLEVTSDQSVDPGGFKWFETRFTTGKDGEADEIPDNLRDQELVIRLINNGGVAWFDNLSLTVHNASANDGYCAQFRSLITSPVTLRVPQHYATVNDALDCLSGKTIAAPVTIQLADQGDLSNPNAYQDYETLYLTHPNANLIHIIGNPAHPERVRLQFKPMDAPNPGVVLGPSGLGSLNGLTLSGTVRTDFYGKVFYKDTGVSVAAWSRTGLGPSLIVENFKVGLRVSKKAYLDAQGITLRGNETGLSASHFAIVDATKATIVEQVKTGVSVDIQSAIILHEAFIANNPLGIASDGASTLHLKSANFSGNEEDIAQGDQDRIVE